MSNKIAKQILDFQDKIAKAKSERDKAQGRLDSLQQQLKDEYNCPTVAVAEKKIRKLEKEISAQEEKLEQGLNDFQEKWSM